MNTLHVYVNVTNTYNQGWRGLNQQKYVGEFKMLGGKSHPVTEEYQALGNYTFTAVGPKGVDASEAARGLSQELTRTCRCEHDCCGCVSSYASVKPTKKRGQFFVSMSYRQNV